MFFKEIYSNSGKDNKDPWTPVMTSSPGAYISDHLTALQLQLQIVKASWSRLVADPDYKSGEFFGIGDVLFESEGGVNLVRVVNACVSCEAVLNNENSVVAPELEPLDIMPKDVFHSSIPTPFWSSWAHAEGWFRASMNVDNVQIDLVTAINISRSKRRSAAFVYESIEAPERSLKGTWLLYN
ncbi:hypothetical protein M422DRAFT_272041 [Sphaerobolus stellatus SS14]|uniref:Uncharacterized protein n=1 Tax=Sphaerobolus stellatus (strain SS14) TaxID=990650 RepID=A0A0C9TCD2_SPHS4|nr:hypothetical protein M422DRAFT_272041 [Sphaerobolus stellatus SS14]